MGCFNMERSLRMYYGSRAPEVEPVCRGAMPGAHRPVEFTNCQLEAAPIEIPPGGVSLKDCSFRKLDMGGLTIRFFVARGCGFESCNFAGTRFGGGYLGGGEGAGFSQTVYRNCCFDRCGLEGISFGSARFECCSFRDVRLRRWLSFSSEFIDCVFAGDIPEAAFLGRSPLSSKGRRRNDFRGNDFSGARFGSVEFRGGIDLSLQRLPLQDGDMILDRRSERIAIAMAEIDAWADPAERRSASRYLQLFAGSRYDGQEQLYLQNRPLNFIDDALRHRVTSMLIRS
jgi:uncharacterized protein YjbI with pentapeptide repeats